MDIPTYILELQAALANLPQDAIETTMTIFHQARLDGRTIFLVGNGGSAAEASHLACDLGKSTAVPGAPRFRVLALTDSVETITALANDISYESVFVEQLINFVQPGDVLLAISTSGNSPNVLRAVEYAHLAGAITIGWTGRAGGRLAELVDHVVQVPADRVEQVEDVFLVLHHVVTARMRDLSRALAAERLQPA